MPTKLPFEPEDRNFARDPMDQASLSFERWERMGRPGPGEQGSIGPLRPASMAAAITREGIDMAPQVLAQIGAMTAGGALARGVGMAMGAAGRQMASAYSRVIPLVTRTVDRTQAMLLQRSQYLRIIDRGRSFFPTGGIGAASTTLGSYHAQTMNALRAAPTDTDPFMRDLPAYPNRQPKP